MKGLLMFILGLMVGAAVMFALKPDRASEAARAAQEVNATGQRLQDVQRTVERAQADSASLRQELEAAKQELAAAKNPAALPASAQTASAAGQPQTEEEGGRKFAEMIKTVGQSQMKAQMEAKVALLKDRLKLSAEQETTLKNLVTEHTEEMLKAMMKMFQGKGEPADLGKFVRLQLGALPDEIERALTPEQKVEYERFKQEERGNRIEMLANAELMGLQGAGGLTPEQKDQAFARISELVAAEEDANWHKLSTADELRTFFDQSIANRLEGMRPILSESQLKTYEAQVAMQRDVLARLVPALAAPKSSGAP